VRPGRFVSVNLAADVAVIVVTYNSASDVPPLINDLRIAARDRRIRLIVVDNGSSDGTLDILRAHEDIELVEPNGNLGYAGGINAGLRLIGSCDAVLILNPDLTLEPSAMTRLLLALDDDGVGVVVPLMRDENGTIYPSLRREPSVMRALGDAVLGSKIRTRPGFSSEIDARHRSYLESHDVDWATGAALLIRAAVAREVGDWNEDFFLYSEETDYLRRVRESGGRIRFEPSAVVNHRRGGSGTSTSLDTLMAVNRIRYVELHHGRPYALLFRAVVVLAEALRSYNADHRGRLAVILNRRRWAGLPKASRFPVAQ
jgi:GT2 family glycosyltransferase